VASHTCVGLYVIVASCDILLATVAEGSGVSESRRDRYRNRQETISCMLQDGEKHKVWRPGRESFKSSESLDQRQKILLNRIKSYRRGDSRGGFRGGAFSSIERRMEQWRRIELEAEMETRIEEEEKKQREEEKVTIAPSKYVGDGCEEDKEMVPIKFPQPEANEHRRSSRRGSSMSRTMETIMEEKEVEEAEEEEEWWNEGVMMEDGDEEVPPLSNSARVASVCAAAVTPTCAPLNCQDTSYEETDL